MAELETLLKDHFTGIIFLLENLIFVINFPKSLLEPMKVTDFLGFLLDLTPIELKLPGDKIKEPPTEGKEDPCSQQYNGHGPFQATGKDERCNEDSGNAPLFY